MKLGMVGLGKMGANMTLRLLEGGHEVAVYDFSQQAVENSAAAGAQGTSSLKEMANTLPSPRVIWMMVPSGKPVDETIEGLLPHLTTGDILIDGGNSNYKDTCRRAASISEKGVHYLDAGTSGGIWGLKIGYCLMIGGPKEAFNKAEPIFKTLAPPDGYAYMGGSGSGHFVKMVHNGIEYGMLEAYAEGFEILHASEYDLDLKAISHLWNQGSVVRSWLLELAERAFDNDADLSEIRGYVDDSGEGRWTVLEAMEKNIPAPILTLSLLARFASRQDESFSAKVIAALRSEFGGHAVKKTEN